MVIIMGLIQALPSRFLSLLPSEKPAYQQAHDLDL